MGRFETPFGLNRELVIEAIRESLPEFAQRNKIYLSEQIMDNLATWASSSVPSGYYRAQCGNYPLPCACYGRCQFWLKVSE